MTAYGVAPECDGEERACRWTFTLGADGSRTLFDELRSRLEACPDMAGMTRDQGVNHPDFYDAWIFQFADAALSVSIKDKAALGQTFVVLRTVKLP